MASLMKKTEQYQALPAKVSQQVLRGLDRNWKSFFAASSEFKSHPDKFLVKNCLADESSGAHSRS
jgi:putative transposase